VPFDAVTGPAYVQVINPPFIGFTATGNDPDGGFFMTAPEAAPGGSSLRFFGTGSGDVDRVKIPLGPQSPGLPVDVGGDFTVEFWMKTAAGNQTASCSTTSGTTPIGDGWINGNVIIDRDVFGAGDDGDYGISLYGTGGRIAFGVARGAAGATICGSLPSATASGITWRRRAIPPAGALRLFIDGQADGPAVSGATGEVGYRNGRATAHPNSDPFLVLGAEKHDVGLAFHGWIDELRISHVVRYSGAFTPPGGPFNTDANTAALYHFDEDNGNTVVDSRWRAGARATACAGPAAARRARSGRRTRRSSPGTPSIALQVLGSVSRPTSITSCGDNRLFITEQSGAIRIWDGTQILATPFLTISPSCRAASAGC
jgi:hypothetical protein